MRVDRERLEQTLGEVRRRCRDPVAGPWGPRSVMWRISREKGVLLAGGRAALLQLAHPYVGEAVAASSLAVQDPMLRFHRTFEAVYAMVFGPLDRVVAASRRVHQVHTGVSGALPAAGRWSDGHRYEANEPHALEWVLATLVDSAVHAFELTVGPLSAEDREQFWADSRHLGLLMGIDGLPSTWSRFSSSVEATLKSDTLAVTPRAAEVGRRLLAPPAWATAPMWATYRAVTASMLPERLHEPFGLRYGIREVALAHAALAAIRTSYPRIPDRVRCVPAYHEARWRLAGGGARVDKVGRWLENLALGLLLRPAG